MNILLQRRSCLKRSILAQLKGTFVGSGDLRPIKIEVFETPRDRFALKDGYLCQILKRASSSVQALVYISSRHLFQNA